MKRNSPSLRVLVLLSAAAAIGCSGGVSVSSEGSVATGGGSVALAVADVSGAGAAAAPTRDVLVASPARGEVDVLVRKDAASWRLYGSFYGGGETVAVTAGRVGGGAAVVARNRDGSIALLAAEAGAQHRLAFFPVQIYHRVRNGKPIDNTPPASWVAVADLDGDGDVDALVAAPGLGIVVLPKLAAVLAPGVNPENPPPVNGYKLAAGAAPAQVAAVDLDGDGRPDVAALDGQTARLDLYRTVSQSPLDLRPAGTVTLPALGAALAATGCARAPLLVTLVDGRVVALGRDGQLLPVVDKLVPVRHVAASGDGLAVDSEPVPGFSLFDACGGGSGALLGLGAASVAGVVMTPLSAAREREIVVLEKDGNTVDLFLARDLRDR